MQSCVLLHCGVLYQIHQPGKDALLVHHFESGIFVITSAVEEKESGNHVKRRVVLFLQQTVQHLPPHIFFMCLEQVAL